MIKISIPSITENNGSVSIGDPALNKMQNILGYVRESSQVTPLLGSGSLTLDCSTQSIFRKTGGTCTITFSNLVENQQINLAMESTGSAYTLTFAGGTFKFPSGTQPTPTATAGKVDMYSFIKVNGIIYSNAILGF